MGTLYELKKILKHSSIYSLTSIIAKVVGFLMLPLYTRYLTPSDYGVLNLLDLSASLLSIIIGMGVRSALFRFYYQEGEIGKKRILTTALFLIGSISGVIIAVLLPFSRILSKMIIGKEGYSFLLIITLITLWFNLIIEIGISYILILQKSTFYLAISLSRLLIGVVFNIIFLVIFKMGVRGMVYSGFITNLPIALLFVGLILKRCGYGISRSYVIMILKFCLPLIPADLGRFSITYADHFLVRRFAGLTWAGIYSLSYQFGLLLSLFVTQSFIRIWHVKRFELYSKGEEREVSLNSFLYYYFVLISSGLLLSTLIRDVVRVMLHPDFEDVHRFVPIIVLGYIFQGAYYFFDFGIYLKKRTIYFTLILLATAALNIVLNMILIPAINVTGAAIATDVSLLFMTALCYIISRRYYNLPYDLWKVSIMLLFALFLFLVSSIFRIESIPLSIVFNLALSFAFSLIVLFTPLLPEEGRRAILTFMRSRRPNP